VPAVENARQFADIGTVVPPVDFTPSLHGRSKFYKIPFYPLSGRCRRQHKSACRAKRHAEGPVDMILGVDRP